MLCGDLFKPWQLLMELPRRSPIKAEMFAIFGMCALTIFAIIAIFFAIFAIIAIFAIFAIIIAKIAKIAIIAKIAKNIAIIAKIVKAHIPKIANISALIGDRLGSSINSCQGLKRSPQSKNDCDICNFCHKS